MASLKPGRDIAPKMSRGDLRVDRRTGVCSGDKRGEDVRDRGAAERRLGRGVGRTARRARYVGTDRIAGAERVEGTVRRSGVCAVRAEVFDIGLPQGGDGVGLHQKGVGDPARVDGERELRAEVAAKAPAGAPIGSW